MKQISIEQLQANHFYWARRRQPAGTPIGEPPEFEVIRISTIFGSAQEFWTVAVSGSEEHFDLEAFEYLHKVPSPPIADSGCANLTVIYANSRTIGH